MTLEEYSKELGLTTPMTVERLITSHKHLTEELNRGQRKEWRDSLLEAAKRAEQEMLDHLWIRKSELRGMTIAELVEMLYEGD